MSEASWWACLHGDPSSFLLDDDEPGVVWRTLVELLHRPEDSPAVTRAREASRGRGAAAVILGNQHDLGYWGTPRGYGMRWGGTAWQLVAAALLGADPDDPRVGRGVEVLLDVVEPRSGGFATAKGKQPAACFTAELCTALARFGFAHHPRVREAIAWLAARPADTGGWTCPELHHLAARACPVAAVAVLRLAAEHPARERASLLPLVDRAVSWLVSHGMFRGEGAPRGWLRFAHPNLARADLVDALHGLARLRLPLPGEVADCVRLVRDAQDEEGRWWQGARVAGGEEPGAPSRWVTLKALVVLSVYGTACGEVGGA